MCSCRLPSLSCAKPNPPLDSHRHRNSVIAPIACDFTDTHFELNYDPHADTDAWLCIGESRLFEEMARS